MSSVANSGDALEDTPELIHPDEQSSLQFAMVPLWVMESVTPSSVMVYLWLHSYTSAASAVAFPARKTLAERAGLSINTVDKALRELRDAGAIRIIPTYRGDGSQGANRYQIMPGMPPKSGGTHPNDMGRGVSPSRGEGYPLAMGKQEPEPINQNQLEPEGERKRPPSRRGTRLPDGWMPSQHVVQAMSEECPGVDQRMEYRKFVDHWAATPGAKGVKADWDATWRNWIRRAAQYTGSRSAPGTMDRMQEILDIGDKLMAQQSTGGKS